MKALPTMKFEPAFIGVTLAVCVAAQCFGQTDKNFAVRLVDREATAIQPDPTDEDLVPPAETNTYLDHALWLKRHGQIGSDALASAYVCIDARTGLPVVAVTFTPEGASAFADLTRQNVGREIAIVVNGKIVTTPVVREPILGGTMQISGNLTIETAEALVSQMVGGDVSDPRPEPKTCPGYMPNYRRVGGANNRPMRTAMLN